MGDISDFFTVWDWVVVFGYLLLTTWVGHMMRGKQATIKDFFLGGRSLPWPAVSGSIIATEISGVTFIGVPGIVMAANGDFTYLQWAIGSMIGRVVVAWLFVKVYYEENIYSPYDYMGKRLGEGVKRLATIFFTVGSILAQSVRVLVAALPLRVVTGLDFEICILIIGIFAIGWTLMGGMRTVIWTDVMQFGLFALGGVVSLFWIIGQLDGGWGEYWAVGSESGKFRLIDLGVMPDLQFTLWVALLAVPFQNLSMFGVDQLNAQRVFCCKNESDARKALVFSCVGQTLTVLMLMVGAALYVFYLSHPPVGAVADYLQLDGGMVPRGENGGDGVFPAWIVSELPPGLSGLILAGLFAAAISSLDSILAALSQTTLSIFWKPSDEEEGKQRQMLWISRGLVIFWGAALTLFTFLMYAIKDDVPILSLAFGMTSYTVGPLLGMFVAALLGKGNFRGLAVGAVLSFLLVLFVRTDVWLLVGKYWTGVYELLAVLPSYVAIEGEGGEVVGVTAVLFSGWLWPVTAVLTYLCAALFAGRGAPRVVA